MMSCRLINRSADLVPNTRARSSCNFGVHDSAPLSPSLVVGHDVPLSFFAERAGNLAQLVGDRLVIDAALAGVQRQTLQGRCRTAASRKQVIVTFLETSRAFMAASRNVVFGVILIASTLLRFVSTLPLRAAPRVKLSSKITSSMLAPLRRPGIGVGHQIGRALRRCSALHAGIIARRPRPTSRARKNSSVGRAGRWRPPIPQQRRRGRRPCAPRARARSRRRPRAEK